MEKEYIPIVSTNFIPGHKVKELKGLVWATSIRAKNFFQDLAAIARIFIGGEIHEYMDLTNEARQEVLKKLNENAKFLGGNAIIGVKLVTSQIVPGTIEILAYGTAVLIEKE